jgi:hypothetical protein
MAFFFTMHSLADVFLFIDGILIRMQIPRRQDFKSYSILYAQSLIQSSELGTKYIFKG